MASIEYILMGISALLFLSILASKASGKLGIPSILLFLILGMVAGSEGPGGIYFDDPRLAQSLGTVALALILFSGGLDTEWERIRVVIRKGLVLSTLGVLMTALLLGLFASTYLGFSFLEGLLLGSIVSSTDAAAVFAVLRSRNVSLKGRLRPLLELESGSNDPMAVFLTIGMTGLLAEPETSPIGLAGLFLRQMILGGISGYAIGRIMNMFINRIRLEYEGLYPVLSLSIVLFTYGVTSFIGGSGFLAVYIAAITLGSRDFIHKRSLMRFHDGIAWLMQIAMFLTLGLLVFPSELAPITLSALACAAFLMFIARPVSVFFALALSDMDLRERAMVSWVGLRGAVPIILATFPLLAGVPRADAFFNLVFFIVIASILVQGTSIPLVARWLGVDAPMPQAVCTPQDFVQVNGARYGLTWLQVPPGSPAANKLIVELGLPRSDFILLIKRSDGFIVPCGSTALEVGDSLLVLADERSLQKNTLLSILGNPGD